MTMNVLFITLDQFRGDCLSIAGHSIVKTPNLDRLCESGVRFARHYSQASPCAPGRASLYTGMYQMNHRVVANGTPLNSDFDNVALAARRAGYVPTLFGYTDQSIDPRVTTGADDPRLQTYEGVLPGFDCVVDLTRSYEPWREFLRNRGHVATGSTTELLKTENERHEDDSCSAFLTDSFLEWVPEQKSSWFAHVSYIRPHPPYSAAGKFSTMYDPSTVGEPITCTEDVHPFHEVMLQLDGTKAPTDAAEMAHMRAQYFGMVSEVDSQVGRVLDWLQESGQWDNTMVVVVADHAELLGDHGLREKVGYWETSQHIVGIVRDPRSTESHGTVVNQFTENIDIMPTLCEAMSIAVPVQCDGMPLTPFLQGVIPQKWRDAAHWEYDWRFALIPFDKYTWPVNRRLEQMNLAVRRTNDFAYVQFGDGDFLCFDMANDSTQRTLVTDPAIISEQARAMLVWRMEHANRTLTGLLVEDGGIGRWPTGVSWRDEN